MQNYLKCGIVLVGDKVSLSLDNGRVYVRQLNASLQYSEMKFMNGPIFTTVVALSLFGLKQT